MIFPDWNEAAAQEAEEVLPLYTDWAVDWTAGRFALREAVERLKPAHLAARVVPCGQWQGGGVFALVCTGGVLAELSAAAPE